MSNETRLSNDIPAVPYMQLVKIFAQAKNEIFTIMVDRC